MIEQKHDGCEGEEQGHEGRKKPRTVKYKEKYELLQQVLREKVAPR
jgi:hypothetical protein